MGERFASGVKGVALLALLAVVGWGCPVPTGQTSAPDTQSENAALPPEPPQQPAAPAPPPSAEPEPAPLTAAADTVTITTPEGALIEYSKDPDTLIVMMTSEHGGEKEEWDQTPPLRIYGDGRVDVYGNYESYLTQEEMSELLTFLLRKGVLDFDERTVNAQLDRIDAARGKPFADRYLQRIQREELPDSAPTIIEISLQRYKPVGKDGLVASPFKNRIRRTDILGDAAWYPGVEAAAGLAETLRRFVDVIMKETVAEGHRVKRED